MSATAWRCPKCGSTDSLEVRAVSWFRVEQEIDMGRRSAEMMTVPSDHGEYDWDERSRMSCGECECEGEARDFEFTLPPEGCLAVCRVLKG